MAILSTSKLPSRTWGQDTNRLQCGDLKCLLHFSLSCLTLFKHAFLNELVADASSTRAMVGINVI